MRSKAPRRPTRFSINEPYHLIEHRGGIAYLVDEATGVPIPLDEPIFILRGNDIRAVTALNAYLTTLDDMDHIRVMECLVESFEDFHQIYEKQLKKLKKSLRSGGKRALEKKGL